jgi:hypothetical protein
MESGGNLVAHESPVSHQSNDQHRIALLLKSDESLKRQETEHFRVYYETDEKIAQVLAAAMESTFVQVVAFCEDLQLLTPRLAQPLEVVLSDTPQALRGRCKELGITPVGETGFYDPTHNLTLLYDLRNHPDVVRVSQRINELSALGTAAAKRTQAGLRERRDDLVEMFTALVVRHEIAHHVLFHVGVHRRHEADPDWLVEGLACLFENPPLANQRGPAVNPFRLADLRSALGCGELGVRTTRLADRFAQAVQSGRLLRLPELISGRDLLDPTGPHAASRYAQSWSLVWFLRCKHNESFSRYIGKLAGSSSSTPWPARLAREQFETAFGAVDRAFVERWLQFVDEGASPP